MLRLEGTVHCDRPVDEIWPLVSDFARVAEWDPSIHRVTPLDDGPVREGSRYRVDLRAGPGTTAFRYRTLLFDPRARRAMFEGVGWTMRALDDVTVTPEGPGCRVVWRVDLCGRGPLAATEPLWSPFLRPFTARVIEGLRTWLPGGRSIAWTVTRFRGPTTPASAPLAVPSANVPAGGAPVGR